MKFGLALDHQYERGDDIGQRIDDLVELTEFARDIGFSSVYGIHHYLAPLETLQPLTLLARLVPSSGTMTLGTGIYLASLPHPVHIAEEVATLDQLSGGRVALGVGAGYRDEEFDSFGIERSSRGRRLVESVEVMRRLWSGETVDHDGEFVQLRGARIGMSPARPGGPPIYVGATTPATIRRAARIGDSWLSTFTHKIRWATGHLEIFQDELRELGRDVDGREYPIQRELYLADSYEQAVAEAEPHLRRSYSSYADYDMDYLRDLFTDLRKKAFLLGTPDQIHDRLLEHEAAGFNHFIFRVQWLGSSNEVAKRTLRRFADEVMPRLVPAPVTSNGHATVDPGLSVGGTP